MDLLHITEEEGEETFQVGMVEVSGMITMMIHSQVGLLVEDFPEAAFLAEVEAPVAEEPVENFNLKGVCFKIQECKLLFLYFIFGISLSYINKSNI